MSDRNETLSRLSRDQVLALKFASRRQLARWANKRELSPRQSTQRIALSQAVRVLQDHAFVHGCELRARSEDVDA